MAASREALCSVSPAARHYAALRLLAKLNRGLCTSNDELSNPANRGTRRSFRVGGADSSLVLGPTSRRSLVCICVEPGECLLYRVVGTEDL